MAVPDGSGRLGVVAPLGTTQTLAWASSYYLPAILADPIARDLGISSNWFFAAFSASLVISGLLGPRVGQQSTASAAGRCSHVERLSGCGLALLGASTTVWTLVCGLAAAWHRHGAWPLRRGFGALGRIYGSDARAPSPASR